MIVSNISTKGLNDANRLTVDQLQQRLLVAQQEVSSGRLADVGQSLGARTSQTVSFRQELATLNTTIDTNASVTGRLDVTQTSLKDISDTAQTFLGTLIGSQDAQTGAAVAQNEAKANLVSLTSTLNSTFGGSYLFGGENVDAAPITDYYGSPTPANRQAVTNAFQAQFGFPPSDPQVANITPAQMQNFIDTSYSALFEEPQWSANWSVASNQNVQSRISPSEVVETSTNANADGFRKLAKAYTMMADLGVQNMSSETFKVVANSAITFVGEATQDLAVDQGRLGTSEARVANANTKMNAQVNVLTTQVNNLEAVDPFDAATRVNALLTQIQTAFSLTARVQQLSIVNFLPAP
jgi:flagellar hook-associated protein 3 FlgL